MFFCQDSLLMADRPARQRARQIFWTLLADALSIAVIAPVFQHTEIDRLPSIAERAKSFRVFPLIISIPLEQVLCGRKWRQILFDK